jgi:hypothetical protein
MRLSQALTYLNVKKTHAIWMFKVSICLGQSSQSIKQGLAVMVPVVMILMKPLSVQRIYTSYMN